LDSHPTDAAADKQVTTPPTRHLHAKWRVIVDWVGVHVGQYADLEGWWPRYATTCTARRMLMRRRKEWFEHVSAAFGSPRPL